MQHTAQLLCSTGAFSRFPDHTGYQAALTYGPHLDVDGFELMFYPHWYDELDQVASILSRSGLAFPAIHAEKNIGVLLGKDDLTQRQEGVRRLEANCRLGQQLGSEVLILHLWGWPELDDQLENNLALLEQCMDIAQRYNVLLALETIPCRKTDPLSNIHHAIKRDQRSQVALDTEFLALHHQLHVVFEQSWLWQHRIRHVHIKDFGGSLSVDGKRRYLHPGEGSIDFKGFFLGLQQKHYTGNISLESPAIDEHGNVNLEKLHDSLAFLRQIMETTLRTDKSA